MARNIELQNTFSGPLDLLLYLVRRDEIDIHDIPISHVTREYLNEVNRMPEIDVDAGGEFLAMASMLTEIKGRMLLPEVKAEDEDEDEIYDPRQGLVEALLEYKKFKEVAAELEKMSDQFSERYTRNVEIPQFKAVVKDKAEQLGALDLLAAFQRIARRMLNENAPREIVSEEVPTEVRIQQIEEVVVQRKRASFTSILSDSPTEDEMVGFFIAILELIRLNKIVAQQSVDFSEIYFIDYAEYHEELNSQQETVLKEEVEEHKKIIKKDNLTTSANTPVKYLSSSPQRISNIFSNCRNHTRTTGVKRQSLKLSMILGKNKPAELSRLSQRKVPAFPALIQQPRKILSAPATLNQTQHPIVLASQAKHKNQEKYNKTEVVKTERQSIIKSPLNLANIFALKSLKQSTDIKLKRHSDFLTLKCDTHNILSTAENNRYPLFSKLLNTKYSSSINAEKEIITTTTVKSKDNSKLEQAAKNITESTREVDVQDTATPSRSPQPQHLTDAFAFNTNRDSIKPTAKRNNFLVFNNSIISKTNAANNNTDNFGLFHTLPAKRTYKLPVPKTDLSKTTRKVTPQINDNITKLSKKAPASSRVYQQLQLACTLIFNTKKTTDKTAEKRNSFVLFNNNTPKIKETNSTNNNFALFAILPIKRTFKSSDLTTGVVMKNNDTTSQSVITENSPEKTNQSHQRSSLKLSPLFHHHNSAVNAEIKDNIITTNNFDLFNNKPAKIESAYNTHKYKHHLFANINSGKLRKIEIPQTKKIFSYANNISKKEEGITTSASASIAKTQLQLSTLFRLTPKASIKLKPATPVNNFELFTKKKIKYTENAAPQDFVALFPKLTNRRPITKAIIIPATETPAEASHNLIPAKKETTASIDCGQISSTQLQLSSLFNLNPKASTKQQPSATVKSFDFLANNKAATTLSKNKTAPQKRISLF